MALPANEGDARNMGSTMEEKSFHHGREELLEKEMATHSSILVWEIPWKEEPGGAIDHRVTKNQTQLGD